MSLRIIFMGSPDFAVPTLAELAGAGHDIVCVYTQSPKPSGRGQTLRKTAVHQFADSLGVPVRTPKSLKKPPEQEAFAALDADLAVVAAYGLILPKPILEAPRLGCLNLHGSMLPRWRGAAPIQRAIMAGDRLTAVQVMQMEEGLDTGPVLLSETLSIEPDDTAQTLHDKMSAAGAPLMVRAVAALERGVIEAAPQSQDGVTYAAKIDPTEARIDWSWSARQIDCHIRGLSPFPGAWFLLPTDKGPLRVKALMSRLGQGAGAPGEVIDDPLLIACGDGAVRLLTVQREGRQPMQADDFIRGVAIPAGTRLE
jgi:methionyl-tRNA formyltransferase